MVDIVPAQEQHKYLLLKKLTQNDDLLFPEVPMHTFEHIDGGEGEGGAD